MILTTPIQIILFLTLTQSVYEGPVSVDYFKQSFNISSIAELRELRCWDEWKEWNGGKKENPYYPNISDVSYVFFDETNSLYPVRYYRINITSKMKEKYQSIMHVTTACGLSELCLNSIYSNLVWDATVSECGIHFAYDAWKRHTGGSVANYSDLDAHYNEYCNGSSSLDTLMYVLYEKKGRINLIDSKDDCLSSDRCIITTKSVINFLDYEIGVYIVGVGGYGTEYGQYLIQLACEQLAYPITKEEIDPLNVNSNLGAITCGMALHNQSMTNDYPVVYYSLNITATTFFPFKITICSYEDYSFDAYMIEIDKLGLNYNVISKMDHSNPSTLCIYQWTRFGQPAQITLDDLEGNMYYIMVQGFINHAHDFSIYMECHDPPTPSPTKEPTVSPTAKPSYSPTPSPTIPPKIAKELVMGLVFGSCGAFMLLVIVYYLYKWKQYIDGRNNKKESDAAITNSRQDHEAEKHAIELELVAKKPSAKYIANDGDRIKQEIDEEVKNSEEITKLTTKEESVDDTNTEQLEENEDIIQLILSDAIVACEDQSAFDIYQVLALRFYDVSSHHVIPIRPFSSIGINIEFIQLSPFVTTSCNAIIVALTQTFGVTMVVYKLFVGYFSGGDIFDRICVMDEDRWSAVFSLKLLAFLLSLVITLFIGGLMNGVKHDGLYEILSKLSIKHIERIPNIAFWILQIGQAVNFYVCFWAVIGSYVIIFVSNTGEQQDDGSLDYSLAGIDMILNAIALFFMLELDDMLVSDEDYDDCEQQLKNILYNDYVPDTRINTQYMSGKIEDNEHDKGRVERVDSSIQLQGKFSECEGYVVPFMYHLLTVFSVFVTVSCYGSGFIAPFIIFFCW